MLSRTMSETQMFALYLRTPALAASRTRDRAAEPVDETPASVLHAAHPDERIHEPETEPIADDARVPPMSYPPPLTSQHHDE